MIAVLLDLDQTLIDSTAAQSLRYRGEWSKVYQLIPQLQPYPGINQLLSDLGRQNILTAIITSSPKFYCLKVIEYWRWEINTVIGYHDTKNHKPHPEPIIKALYNLNINPDQAIYIGDSANDIIAAKAAGVISIAALWGTENLSQLSLSDPDFSFSNVSALNYFITCYSRNFKINIRKFFSIISK